KHLSGQSHTYQIAVTNIGASNVTGAIVTYNFPTTSTVFILSLHDALPISGFTASGTGNINDTVTMPVGSVITYTVTGTVSPSATGTLSDTATVTAPAGITDPNLTNNTVTDTDTITVSADLKVTVTDGRVKA